MSDIKVKFIGDDQELQRPALDLLARCFEVWAERKRIFGKFPFRELSFIALDGDIVCGHLGLIPLETVADDGSIIRLAGVASVAVAPEYRKRGAAGKMCDAAAHWAKENGFDAMPLYTSVMRVYEKSGWAVFPVEMQTLKAPEKASDSGNLWKSSASLSEEEKTFIVKCYENMPPLPGRIIRVTDAYAANSWQRLFSKDNLLWYLAPQGYILAVDGVIGEVCGKIDTIPAGVDKAFLSIHDAAYSQLVNCGWQKDLPPEAIPECWDGEVAMMKIFHPEKIPAKLFFPLANKF